MTTAFDVSCPHCHATLTISPEAHSVVGHKEPVAPRPVANMDEAVQLFKVDPARRRDLFSQSVEQEKTKTDRLKKSFDDLLNRAQEDPASARPLRDMDLD